MRPVRRRRPIRKRSRRPPAFRTRRRALAFTARRLTTSQPTRIPPVRSSRHADGLQRPDLHLAKLDDALLVGLLTRAALQRDRAARMGAVSHTVDRALAVQRDEELIALGGDLVRVPLT